MMLRRCNGTRMTRLRQRGEHSAACRATPKTRSAARRLRRSVATARRISCCRGALVGRRLGASTRRAPQARQANGADPQALWPFLTMAGLPHTVQHGAAERVLLRLAGHSRANPSCHLLKTTTQ